jgi:hypothetical protein
MDKVIRDGEVAVLYSPGFGAGWYTWNTEHPAMLYDPTLVKWVMDRKPYGQKPSGVDWVRLVDTLKEKYPGCYLGGLRDLQIQWVPVGTRFYVDEYDGNETVVLDQEHEWMVA